MWKNVAYSSRRSTCLEEERVILIDKILKLKANTTKLKENEAKLKVELIKCKCKALGFVLVASLILFGLFSIMLTLRVEYVNVRKM